MHYAEIMCLSWPLRRRWTVLAVLLLAGSTLLAGCHRAVPPLVVPGRTAVAFSGGPNTSMIFLARTGDGILAIDLGWWGQAGAFDAALRELGATPADVRWVFLTHSHRDHIAAWPRVRHARFVLAAAEEPHLFGQAPYRAWVPRWADRLRSTRRPKPGEVATTTFASETTFALGADTLVAYTVPGHTSGSAVYLFRGVLFVGDAMTYSRRGGFQPAKRGYTDDRAAAVRNLETLWAGLPAGSVRYVCTAHGHCTPFHARLISNGADP